MYKTLLTALAAHRRTTHRQPIYIYIYTDTGQKKKKEERRKKKEERRRDIKLERQSQRDKVKNNIVQYRTKEEERRKKKRYKVREIKLER